MADNKRVQEEDLKKLEEQAYFELCQIIAEAMQLQDVDLLNARISSWKNKYKKLLDRPSTNSKSDFKKRIEYLLTQYYSEVTKYILSQLKLNEEKKVENQAKALRELYTIIRDTNDYALLKNKVSKWKEKYPISGFMKMYQKRIELYSRDKNLRENAFKQEEAFRDLVDITKIHGTLDELKNELALWEEKYSINNKYSIDDFIKHQSEVKRFTSDEFLQSIAREEYTPYNIDKGELDIADKYNNNTFSNLSVQANAYASLLKISKSSDSVNEMFTWVYKNSNIKFNDKYKELILSATYLNYSPAYLNKLEKPKIDVTKTSLSFNEYTNISDIKRYAIISYFNLLLPPEKAISNDYFNKHIQTIYAKSERARLTSIKENTTFIEQKGDPEFEETIPTSPSEIIIYKEDDEKEILKNDNPNNLETVINETSIETNEIEKSEVIVDEITIETDNSEKSETIVDELTIEADDSEKHETIVNELTIETDETEKPEIIVDELTIEADDSEKHETIVDEITVETTSFNTTETEPVLDLSEFNEGLTIEFKKDPLDSMTISLETIESEKYNTKTAEEDSLETDNSLDYSYNTEEPLAYESIVAFSPLFFNQIYNYNIQSILVKHIDSNVSEYVEKEKSKEALLNEAVKTKTDEE